MTLDEMIAVLQASKAGKTIEERDFEACPWLEKKSDDSEWRFGEYEYRVKPEPRRLWVNATDTYFSSSHFDSEGAARGAAGVGMRQIEFGEVIK